MIEINLLPGARKKAKRSGGPSFNFGAALAGISEKVKDRWLAAAVVSAVVSLAAVGTLYYLQTRTERTLADSEAKALQDSTRFASVLKQRVHLEAKRDTLLRQLNIIRTIDGDRFVWPHILDEVSRALPPYTWITGLAIIGTPQGTSNAAGPPPAAGAPKPAASDTGKAKASDKKSPRMLTNVPVDTVHFKILGRTVDLQAFTLFMKQLGASPYLTNISLDKSETATESGVQVTDFQLNAVFARPDSSVIRRGPLSVSVK